MTFSSTHDRPITPAEVLGGTAPAQLAVDYLEAVAGTGDIAERNVRAWGRFSIVPRAFRTGEHVDVTTELFGIPLALPVIAAPSAGHGLGNLLGEAETARGVHRAGTTLALSQSASAVIPAVAEAVGPYFQQIYLPEDRDSIRGILESTVDAGARALVWTVDQLDTEFQHPFRTALREWSQTQVVENAGKVGAPARFVSLDDLTFLKEASGLPVIVKGILHPDDALRAIDAGADGIVVSNHGGRQIGASVTTAEVLQEIAVAVDRRVPVLVDSGIRTADDVFIALALGASAVMLGRPVVRALWRDGDDGVAKVFDDLRLELAGLFAMTGVRSIREIDANWLRGRA